MRSVIKAQRVRRCFHQLGGHYFGHGTPRSSRKKTHRLQVLHQQCLEVQEFGPQGDVRDIGGLPCTQINVEPKHPSTPQVDLDLWLVYVLKMGPLGLSLMKRDNLGAPIPPSSQTLGSFRSLQGGALEPTGAPFRSLIDWQRCRSPINHPRQKAVRKPAKD